MKTVSELSNLSDRTALVTGGAGGVAEAIAMSLSEMGCHVVLTDRDVDPLNARVEQIRSAGGKASAIAVDLLDEKNALPQLDEVIAKTNGLDILVNNAAFVGTSNLQGWGVPFEQQDPNLWKDVLELNLTVPFRLTQHFHKQLASKGWGSVINISSIYGLLGPDQRLYSGTEMGNPAAYGASKGGLIQLTRWLATSIAPSVRVNTIGLGGIERGQPESFQEAYVERTPLQRMGNEEDIKGAIGYLASDLSRYVTGQLIMVDGGWSAW